MTVERGLRLMAGAMVLFSLALAHFLSPLLALADGLCRSSICCSLPSPTGARPCHAARNRAERRRLHSEDLGRETQ